MISRTWIVLLAFVAFGCETSTAPAPAAGSAVPTTSSVGKVVSSAATTSSAAVGVAGKGPVVTLGGGATVTLPAGVETHRAPSTLPEQIKSTHTYAFPGEQKRLIVVTELELEGDSCAKRLDTEWKKMQDAQADTNEARAALRKMGRVEDAKVSGHRVLYSEAMQRGIAGKDKGRPFAPITTAMMCEGDNMIAIMHIATQASDGDVRTLLYDVVKTYKAAP